MSQKPLLTYTLPSTILAFVSVSVASPDGSETGLAYWYAGSAAVPVFSNCEFGYRFSRYRFEYSVTSWSVVAPSTSTTSRRSFHVSVAAALTSVNERPSTSSARFLRAWSRPMNDVATRSSTVSSDDVSKVA